MSKLTIREQMGSFQKHLWSNEKPMEFATSVVEELLLEIQRLQTIMRASLDEIDGLWEHHRSAVDEEDLEGLVNLMDSLGGRRQGFYPQYLSPEEYQEFIYRQTDLGLLAQEYEEVGEDDD